MSRTDRPTDPIGGDGDAGKVQNRREPVQGRREVVLHNPRSNAPGLPRDQRDAVSAFVCRPLATPQIPVDSSQLSPYQTASVVSRKHLAKKSAFQSQVKTSVYCLMYVQELLMSKAIYCYSELNAKMVFS